MVDFCGEVRGLDGGGESSSAELRGSDSLLSDVLWTFCGAEGGGEVRPVGRVGRFFHSVSKICCNYRLDTV
jgi:hypothetical protein